jgi:hypothetical protein
MITPELHTTQRQMNFPTAWTDSNRSAGTGTFGVFWSFVRVVYQKSMNSKSRSLKWLAPACKLLAIFVSVIVPMVLHPRWGVNPIADVQLVGLAILALIPNRWLVFSSASYFLFLLLALFPFRVLFSLSAYRGGDIGFIAFGLLIWLVIFAPLPLSLLFSRIRLRRGDKFVFA